jgi:hypothetical protein
MTKLNDSIIDLRMKISKSSNADHEISELRKSITQSQSQSDSKIGFKPSFTTFQAVPATSYLLDGVISYLTTRYHGNVHDCGIARVFADRVCSGEAIYAAKNVADLQTGSYFHSANESNQCVGYDFKELIRIIPTHYSIRSYDNGPNFHHLRSWVVEISNDGQRWTVIDGRTDCVYLNDTFTIQCFTIQNPPQTEIQYIRLRQTGVNWYGHHHIIIYGFEIFGELQMKDREEL